VVMVMITVKGGNDNNIVVTMMAEGCHGYLKAYNHDNAGEWDLCCDFDQFLTLFYRFDPFYHDCNSAVF